MNWPNANFIGIMASNLRALIVLEGPVPMKLIGAQDRETSIDAQVIV